MKYTNDEIEEMARQMSEYESRPTLLLSLPLVQLIDRAVGAERKLMEAEFRRCNAALEAYARAEDLRHEAGDAKIQKANEVLEYREYFGGPLPS